MTDQEILGAAMAYTDKHGGGGGGTTNYNQLSNKPQIAGTTLQGNKSLSDLGIASATALGNVSDAVTAIKDGTEIDSFGDVETALAGKQGTLTAGDYINLNNGNISVNRNLVGNNYDYEIKSTGDYKLTIIKSQGGTVISTNTYDYSYGTSTNIDNNFTIAGGYSGGNTWVYTALKDSTTHSTGYTWTKSVEATFEETEAFPSEDLSGYKLVIKSEMDSAINAAVSSAYHHAGTKTCAELVAGLLVAGNEGNVYNMTDSGTTTADFIEGAGQPIKAGDNVGVCKVSDGVYKFDLLSGFVDTSNFVQKSETAGLLKNDGTVDTTIQGDVSTLKSGLTNLDNEVNGDATVYPYADVITIEDAVPANVADCNVKIEPVQDLHGYDKPWVGGAGKNKLPMTVDGIKAANTTGTWSGNTYTYNGVTYDILDNDGNVVGIKVNGTPGTGGSFFYVAPQSSLNIANDTEIILSGCPQGGSWGETETYALRALTSNYANKINDVGNGATFNYNDAYTRFYIELKTTVTNLVFTPMIRLSTETDATFAPYTNICPITGHTEASVQRDGKNLFDSTDLTEIFPGLGKCVKAPIKSGQTYTISVYDSAGQKQWLAIYLYKDAKWSQVADFSPQMYDTKYTFTAPEGATKVCINGATYITRFPQCELGSEKTPYVPYAGKTYTIALGDTVYGGTVDFDSGVMTVDRASLDMGTLGWFKDSTNVFKATLSDGKYGVNLICSQYYATTNVNVDGTIFFNNAYYGDNKMAVCDSRYTEDTAETFAIAMDGVQLVYELATPFTIALKDTPINLVKGHNTIYANTGDVEVTVNNTMDAIGSIQEQVNGLAEKIAPITIIRKGEVNFANLAVDNVFSSDITFDTPMPNANYTVTASASGTTVAVCNIGNRTKNGFTVYVRNIGTAAIGGAVMWQAIG